MTHPSSLLLQLDLPRILRADQTEITELVAKYRGIEAHLIDAGNEEAVASLRPVFSSLLQVRQALHETSVALSSAQGVEAQFVAADAAETLADRRVQGGPDIQPESPSASRFPRIKTGGRAMPLPEVLVTAGLASSTINAKKGVRAGQCVVNGQVMTNPDRLLDLGVYEIQCGELEPRKVELVK